MMAEIYHIEGMSCAARGSMVKRVTRKLDGVEQSDVNLTTNRVTITYDKTKVNQGMIEDRVKRAGFAASLTHENEEEKKQGEAEAVHQEELLHVVRRQLIVAVCFAVPLLCISAEHMLPFTLPLPAFLDTDRNPLNFSIAQLVLAVLVLISGQKFYLVGIRALSKGSPNMDPLVAIGTGSAFPYNLFMTFTVSSNPMNTHHLYYESAAIAVMLTMLSRYMESRSKGKTSKAIQKLTELAPNTVMLYENGTERGIETVSVHRGQHLLIKSRSWIPLDGIVASGTSSVDGSMLTGESTPVEKQTGGAPIGGSMSYNGAMELEVTKIGAGTILSKIIKLIEDAQGKKVSVSKLADRVAGIFVPTIMVIALVAALLWRIFGGKGPLFVLTIFVAALVIVCPCAPGLAAPTTIIVGTGVGASHGILIKNGEALESSHKANAIVPDKAGMITEGKSTVMDVMTADAEYMEGQLFYLAGSCEQVSEHPLGEAIVEAVRKEPEDLKRSETFFSITGVGVEVELDGRKIAIGNQKLLDEKKVSIGDVIESRALSFANQGRTPMYVVVDGVLKGMICVADIIEETSMAAVNRMKSLGIEIYILTGDNRQTAEYIGRQAYIDQVIVKVLPKDKANVVSRLQNEGKTVIMVGGRINDVPALVQAGVGTAIGSGSDIALESGDIVLMRSDLRDVYQAVRPSRATIRNIKQNLFWAFLYDSLGIPMVVGPLHLFGEPLLDPMITGLAMSLSSVCVVSNALKLKVMRLQGGSATMAEEITREEGMLQEGDVLVMQERRGCYCSQQEKRRTDKEERNLMNRLSWVEGQIRGIKFMAEDDHCRVDILTQVSAMQAVLDSLNKMLLLNHIEACVVEDIERGDTEVVDELCGAIQKLMRQGNRAAVEF